MSHRTKNKRSSQPGSHKGTEYTTLDTVRLRNEKQTSSMGPSKETNVGHLGWTPLVLSVVYSVQTHLHEYPVKDFVEVKSI